MFQKEGAATGGTSGFRRPDLAAQIQIVMWRKAVEHTTRLAMQPLVASATRSPMLRLPNLTAGPDYGTKHSSPRERIMLTTEPEIAICKHCLTAKPVENFRRRRKSDQRRQRVCRDCHTANERDRRHFHSEQRRLGRVRRFVLAVNAEADARRIALLVRVTMEAMGGLEAFAEKWIKHFLSVDRKRGHKRALDFYSAVSRLIIAASELKPPTNYESLDDDELDAEQDALVEAMLRADPELAKAVCETHGWTVTQPSKVAASE